MARKRLSEYSAKRTLLDHLTIPYTGLQFIFDKDTKEKVDSIDPNKSYVVKVDEGIKKRFKQGLVKLNIPQKNVYEALKELHQKGYQQMIVEEYRDHDPEDERYLSIQRVREGMQIFSSRQGGVDIESNEGSIKTFLYPKDSLDQVAAFLQVEKTLLEKILEAMDAYHISFLEINPLVVTEKKVLFLDLAIEVDSAGEFFAQRRWTAEDFVGEGQGKTRSELLVDQLSQRSQASFRLVALNPEGSIFMLLSGGGASIVLADEVYNQGYGYELANYGEYSGNPNAEETFLYTSYLLDLLITSKAKNKVLIIAGGVANFTDVRVTFKGIIQALNLYKKHLQEQKVKVYVRRGGPFQEEGLRMIEEFLQQEKLLGRVEGPELVLTDIVNDAVKEIK